MLIRQREFTLFDYTHRGALTPAFMDDRQQRRWGQVKAVAMFAFVAMVVAVLIIPIIFSKNSQLGRPQTHYAAIVDLTAPLAERQLSHLRTAVQHWSDSLAVGDRISLYVIVAGSGGAATAELFSGQKPRDGSAGRPGSRWPISARSRWAGSTT